MLSIPNGWWDRKVTSVLVVKKSQFIQKSNNEIVNLKDFIDLFVDQT